MKKVIFFTCLITLIFFIQNGYGQEDDPLADSYIIHAGGGGEIVTAQFGYDGEYYIEFALQKYYKALEVFDNDSLVKALTYRVNLEEWDAFRDIAVDDLDNDGFSEIIGVINDGNELTVVLLKADHTLLGIDTLASWKTIVQFTISDPAPYEEDIWFHGAQPFVEIGNFDADSLKEMVISYWADNGNGEAYAYVQLFDIDDSLHVTALDDIMDQAVPEAQKINLCEDYIYLFEVTCADMNGDGIDEILLGGRQPRQPYGYEIFANIYSYDSLSGEIVPELKEVLFSQPDTTYDIAHMNIGAGYFGSKDYECGIIGLYQYVPEARAAWVPDTVSYILLPFECDEELMAMDAPGPFIQQQDTLPMACYYNRISTLKCVDFNQDGFEEIISAFSLTGSVEYSIFTIFESDEQLNLQTWADMNDPNQKYLGSVAAGDVVVDSLVEELKLELLIPVNEFEGIQYHGRAIMFQIHTDEFGDFQEAVVLDDNLDLPHYKSEQVQIGDFDGDIRLGAPNRFSITEIVQPLVILNAPPIHFDVFDDQSYDISLSYNENEGQFISTYIKESSQTIEVESEFHQDWGTSSTLKAGGGFWGISVSTHMTETYGEKFSRVAGTSTKVTVNVEADAVDDDRIYAAVVNYDLWEYPVYGNFELQGHVLVVRPTIAENLWMHSKSWSGYSYIPNHEVGNILSYREYPLLSDNPEVAEKIKGDYSDSFVLDANSSWNWSLLFENFAENEVSTAREYSREYGAEVDVWGSGYSYNDTYHEEEINTHRTEVASGLQLDVHLDALDMSIGEVSYIVTPYAYWSINGALVIDYAVRPELSQPGGTPTWWQVHYEDLADPAFILPWSLDPEKGYTLEEEAKRYQTKDLLFFPRDPADGETVLIRARVHNFSLIATPGPVGVKFYIGDPDSGGTLMVSESGLSEIYTPEAIAPRGTHQIQMNWQVPPGIGTFPRIYAVIDEDENLAEVHERNNKGWGILAKSTVSALEEKSQEIIPLAYSLDQNYPNPFNPVTTISFSLPKAGQTRLDIFNALGERVATAVNRPLYAGKHAYRFDARELPSGIYFYRLKSGSFITAQKMVLIK